MEVDDDDFKQHFALLPDEALLSIRREDLIDAARQIYEQELTSRGLRIEERDVEEYVETDDYFVSVATFLFPLEAAVARSFLQSADILCYLENEHSLNTVWTWNYALRGLRLMVPASCIEEAREILNQPLSDEEFVTFLGVGMASEGIALAPNESTNDKKIRGELIFIMMLTRAIERIHLFYFLRK